MRAIIREMDECSLSGLEVRFRVEGFDRVTQGFRRLLIGLTEALWV